MTRPAVLVTGVAGGIGDAIGRQLRREGYFVIGVDRRQPEVDACDHAVSFDFLRARNADSFRAECIMPVMEALGDNGLVGLVNNAALQVIGPTEDVALSDWDNSFLVNVTMPMLLAQAFLNPLRRNSGCIVNVGSVHAQATKPEFVTYATTKSALHGLTRALAVDLGPRVRAICLAPAAIATPMLREGFVGKEDALAQLEACHPAGRVGSPAEVAQAVAFLLSDRAGFLTGATLYLDGGILCRLHDPV